MRKHKLPPVPERRGPAETVKEELFIIDHLGPGEHPAEEPCYQL